MGTVEEVRLVYEDRLVARHARCWQKEQYIDEPVHYLAVFERKPGGFDHARPLEIWRSPECLALLHRRLEAEHGGAGIKPPAATTTASDTSPPLRWRLC